MMLCFPNLHLCVTCNVKKLFFHKEFIVENLKMQRTKKDETKNLRNPNKTIQRYFLFLLYACILYTFKK